MICGSLCNNSAQAFVFFAARKQQNLNAMNDYYGSVPLEESEQILANREYWDNISGEWEMCSKMEDKLVRLGTFVQRGGDLNRVISLYAEGREYTYRVTIQHCIERYLEALTNKRVDNLKLRLFKLEKEEAVKLLSEMLKVSINVDFRYDKYTSRQVSFGVLDTRNLDAEGILSAIEQEHRQAHPDESIEEVRKRAHTWIGDSWW